MFALIMSKGCMIYYVYYILPPKHSIQLVRITLQLSTVMRQFMKTDITRKTWAIWE